MKELSKKEIDSLKTVSLACLKNSSEFLRDADLLNQQGSHGHATALAIIALEELAKAQIYYMSAYNLIEITPIIKKTLNDHTKKYKYLAGLDFVYYYVKQLSQSADTTKMSSKEIMDFIIEKTEKSKDDSTEEFKVLKRSESEFGKLREIRESALYVELKETEIHTPYFFNPGDSNKILQYAKNLFNSLGGIYYDSYADKPEFVEYLKNYTEK